MTARQRIDSSDLHDAIADDLADFIADRFGVAIDARKLSGLAMQIAGHIHTNNALAQAERDGRGCIDACP